MSEVTILRVSNGWVVREGSGYDGERGFYKRMAVARSPQELAAWIVEYFGRKPEYHQLKEDDKR